LAGKMVAVSELTPGSVLADAVITIKGKTLLGKGVQLTPRHISLLRAWDIRNVFIETGEAPAEEPPEVAPEASQEKPWKATSQEYREFVQELDSLITRTAQAFHFIQKQSIVPLPELTDTTGKIYSSIRKNSLTSINCLLLGDCKLADFISRHSVMVAFFAGNIARAMKWNEDDIQGAVLSGLLHDIGSLTAGKIDDRGHGRPHIAETAALLKKVRGLSDKVILGVVQHCECMDGSGFPTAASGAKIHPYARIISVANIFHIQAYSGEHANPFPVLDLLAHEMFGKLDTAVCHTFINQVRDSLINNKILLSDGQEAEIIFFHPYGSCLPIVRTSDSRIIDLSKRGSSAITRIVPPS